MKMIMAVVSNCDVSKVMSALSSEGFFTTKINTAGQFLSDGNTTVCIGTEEEKIETVYDIVKNNVTKRVVTKAGVESTLEGSLLKKPVDVEEYGAVAFVIDIEDFKRL